MNPNDKLEAFTGLLNGPCAKALNANLKAAFVPHAGKYDLSLVDRDLSIGVHMEEAKHIVKEAAAELTAVCATAATTAEETTAVLKRTSLALVDYIKDIRSQRMTIVGETRDCLSALRDVRKFFLDSDYETEVARLERLVKLCRDIQELKTSGVFDAVLDSALRIAK